MTTITYEDGTTVDYLTHLEDQLQEFIEDVIKDPKDSGRKLFLRFKSNELLEEYKHLYDRDDLLSRCPTDVKDIAVKAISTKDECLYSPALKQRDTDTDEIRVIYLSASK